MRSVTEVTPCMDFHRHDLFKIDASHWQALVSTQSEDTRAFWLHEWESHDWPVIVRRDDCKSSPDSVAIGVPLPPSCGKLRIALHVPVFSMRERLSPVLLAECRHAAPQHWGALLNHLEALGDATKIAPQVCGSLLWQHLNGLTYLHDASDIDVLWPVTSLSQAHTIADSLPEIERRTGIRIDGEIISKHGWGIHWREFVKRAPAMLVKTRGNVELRSEADVLKHLAEPA
jgi:phosphoribosyl-dephospho-CoA transferase